MWVKVDNPMSVAWANRAMVACGATKSLPPLQLYRARHSVIYAVQFWLEIGDITERVHMHLVRSHVGFIPWVRTQRPDRKGKDGLRNMAVLCNAEALINLAQKRLCTQAWYETRDVVLAIRDAVREHDPALADVMQPRCVWEGRCRQVKPCGWYNGQQLAGDNG
jgi:hypothetical protein